MGSKLKKTCLTLLLTFTLILSGFTGSAWGQENGVQVNGAQLDLSASLVNDNGRLLVPAEALVKTLEASFSQRENGELLIQKTDRTLVFSNSTLLCNGRPISLETKPRTIGGVWFLPLRVTAESLDCTVEWNAVSQTAQVWGPTSDVAVIDILGINDFHGALEESGKDPGLAKLGSYLRQNHDRNPEGTLILSAGDMFQGSMLSTVLKGKPVTAAMNDIGFDAMALGNHEFDWGIKTLQGLKDLADFPFLAANLFDRRTGEQPEGIEPYVVIKRQGTTIGIIGLITLETLECTSSERLTGLEIRDPAMVLRNTIPKVRQQGAEVVVVLSHLGCSLVNGQLTGEAVELVKAVPGIDALLAGHSHQMLAGEIQGVPVVQAAYNGRAVESIRLFYSRGQKQLLESLGTVADIIPANLMPDPGVSAIIDSYGSEVKSAQSVILGQNLSELAHDRYQVSPVGCWVSDVIRQAASADVAFLNGGSLRTPLPAGNLTVGQFWNLVPFDNTMVLQEMTGTDILKVLEYGINNAKYGSIQFSGLKVHYDAAKPAGQRVFAITLADKTPLVREKSYRVVANDFIAGGGDGFIMFREAGTPQINTNQVVRNVLMDYIKQTGTVDFKDDQRFIEIK